MAFLMKRILNVFYKDLNAGKTDNDKGVRFFDEFERCVEKIARG